MFLLRCCMTLRYSFVNFFKPDIFEVFFEVGQEMNPSVAIVGQGVIGCSTALAVLQRFPKAKVVLIGDRPFEKICSFGPAGLFRLDKFDCKPWAKASFERFAEIEKQWTAEETGVKLVSGHIQSDSEERLKSQEKNMADIVYNFRWLTDREKNLLFVNPSKYCIHYTAYASEGRRYVPWLKRQIEALGGTFVTKSISKLSSLADDGFNIVVNATGLAGGKLAGDDDTVFPVRGVAFEVHAPWHKHFNYRDFSTFTIPMVDSVIVGSVKQDHRDDLEITDVDRREIFDRYELLHPAFKGVKVISEWSALRPERPMIRLEKVDGVKSDGGKYTLIHNYGHGSNGFTMGWGCALDVVKLIEEAQGIAPILKIKAHL
uniref:DAO domain-containing protein n=1 Tax=Panagrellus redivivus TaxID=6233 RepID=A0A7E4VW65_PANRE